MKKGLVLEGGAMRGLFTAGVIDVMMKNNIVLDGLIGVSAGACFGCNYKSKQIGRSIRYNKKYCRHPRYCSFRSLFLTGDLFEANFCYHILPTELDPFDGQTFEQNPMEFYLVCTNVETGEAVYKKCDVADFECFEWVRASASMPLVSRVVPIQGGKYLDGAIADSIPLQFFQSIGYEKNIVILTQPDGYVKEECDFMPLVRIALRKYPKCLELLEKRHIMYNDTLEYIRQQEKLGKTLVIRPENFLPIGRISHKPEKLQETYDIGCHIGEKWLPKIKEFLS